MLPDYAGIVTKAMNEVSDALTVKPEEVRAVIKTTRDQADLLDTESFKNAKQKVNPAVFGGYEGAAVVVNAHSNAHTITQSTIKDVKAALFAFATQLEGSLKDLGAAEDQSKAMLDKLAVITPGDAGTTTHETTEQQTGFDINGEPSQPKTDEGSP